MRGVLEPLKPIVDRWLVTRADDPRATAPEALVDVLGPGCIVSTHVDVAAACEFARCRSRPGDRVVVFGSFRVVGPAMSALGLYSTASTGGQCIRNMDRSLKERLIGASVLVGLAVWLIPWVLDGPLPDTEFEAGASARRRALAAAAKRRPSGWIPPKMPPCRRMRPTFPAFRSRWVRNQPHRPHAHSIPDGTPRRPQCRLPRARLRLQRPGQLPRS